jgi:hypothetical protein
MDVPEHAKPREEFQTRGSVAVPDEIDKRSGDATMHVEPVDEGMTHRVLIFGLCGFEPIYKPVERLVKACRGDDYLGRPRAEPSAG